MSLANGRAGAVLVACLLQSAAAAVAVAAVTRLHLRHHLHRRTLSRSR